MVSATDLEERQLAQKLKWDRPKAYLDDILFRVQQDDSPWDGGDDYFTLYKDEKLIDQYEHFFAERPSFKAERIFELGMWDGGSVVFWHEFFLPLKHVAIDLADRADSPYFDKYIRSHGREGRVRTFWSTNQGDAPRLRQLLSTEFDGPLDLVLDDASHFYGPSRRSFEILFPALRLGGLYIIEDWAWAHWPEHWNMFANEIPLTKLIFDLVEAAGSSRDWIARITVFQGFTVIERGPATGASDDWRLEDHVLTMPRRTIVRTALAKLRKSIRDAM